MKEDQKYGTLLNTNTKLHRQYFREAVKLLGVRVIYRAPLPGKKWTTYGELDNNFAPPILVGCLFEEHPTVRTMKRLGWDAELQENASLISVDYDLPNLQVGALFIVPSSIDNSQGRLFRVTRLTTDFIYPASVTCEIVPEWEDTTNSETEFDYERSSFNLLDVDEDE